MAGGVAGPRGCGSPGGVCSGDSLTITCTGDSLTVDYTGDSLTPDGGREPVSFKAGGSYLDA